MMRYTDIPKSATLRAVVKGYNEAGVYVCATQYEHKGTHYFDATMDGERVYRRQYSGRNLPELVQMMRDLEEGLDDA